MDVDAREPSRAAKRRREILQTARELFTVNGVGPVTAGTIARTAGVSSGNLYYWFDSKAAIVRALYAEWAAESEIPALADASAEELFRFLWDRVADQARVTSRYDFFARDLLPLLDADPVLADAYRTNRAERIDAFTMLATQVVRAGLLRDPEPHLTVRQVVESAWLLAETAPPFARIVGADPVALVRAGLVPWVTAHGWDVLEGRR